MDSSIKFLCPRWGFENIPWDIFLKQVKDAGFSGIEWFPFGEPRDDEHVLELLIANGLDYAIVMAVIEPYQDIDTYLQKLKDDLDELMQIRNEHIEPLFFSAQTGREFFNEHQIQQCLSICNQLEERYQTPIYQETHRNKWSYAAHNVAPILKKNKDLKLTFDVSHWFCVSESYLEDQQEAVDTAILRTKHIHARVGHTQGSQVWDPSATEYADAFAAHLKIWDKWVKQMRLNSLPITITPEFGPPPYLIKGDRTSNLKDEQWRLILWMKDFLQHRYI